MKDIPGLPVPYVDYEDKKFADRLNPNPKRYRSGNATATLLSDRQTYDAAMSILRRWADGECEITGDHWRLEAAYPANAEAFPKDFLAFQTNLTKEIDGSKSAGLDQDELGQLRNQRLALTHSRPVAVILAAVNKHPNISSFHRVTFGLEQVKQENWRKPRYVAVMKIPTTKAPKDLRIIDTVIGGHSPEFRQLQKLIQAEIEPDRFSSQSR